MKPFLVVVIVVLAAARVWGQASAGPGFDALATPVTIEEAVALATDARLGESGIAAAKSLVEGCEARLQRDARRMDRVIERAYLTRKLDDGPPIAARVEEERAKRQASHDSAAKEVLADLKTLLPEGAGDAWATFERRRHRRLYLFQSFRLGIRFDLVEIARATKILDLPAVKQVLTPYELDLDRLLLTRSPIAVEWERVEATEGPYATEAARFLRALRDADCAILQLQRATTRRLLEVTPAESRLRVQTEIMRGRLLGGQEANTRHRAGLLLESGRLDDVRRQKLRAAVRLFDEKSLALDDANATAAEDADCSRTYAQSLIRRNNSGVVKWMEDGRKLEVDLLTVLEAVATEDDLDAIEESAPPEP